MSKKSILDIQREIATNKNTDPELIWQEDCRKREERRQAEKDEMMRRAGENFMQYNPGDPITLPDIVSLIIGVSFILYVLYELIITFIF